MGQYGNYPPPAHNTLSRLAITDQHEHKFLDGIENNWCNHRGMLLLGLYLTSGKVTECGAGEGSTPYLEEYCKAHSRQFDTYDSNHEWANKMNAGWVSDWDQPCRWSDIWVPCGLLFVDHAPGEHRKVAVERMKDKAHIIVIHDTELGGAGDYQLEPVLSTFQYRLNYNKTGGGAGATMVSNTIDVNRFRGLSLGPYKFDDD